jgi:phage shock protein PspC (stress-responsive transcriptional regulator)
MGGAGFLAYLICWIIIPAQTDPTIPAPATSSATGGMIVGLILVALGVILLFSWVGWNWYWFPFSIHYWSLPGIFVLIGLGLLIGWVVSRSRYQPSVETTPEVSEKTNQNQTETEKPMTDVPPRRLYRARDFRVIAGICGGLGKYFNLDPTIVRILWVLFGIASLGTALVVYIILIFVIPEEPIE